VVLQAGVSPSRAREALGATAGIVAAALQALGS
jgi:NACalpha-BTF3-like transcription factor